jgi:hypothetical protein
VETNLTDLFIANPKGKDIRFQPTVFQLGIEVCFEEGGNIWLPKMERQIGLTTIICACAAQQVLKGKNILLVGSSHVMGNVLISRTREFAYQWHYKNEALIHPEAFSPEGLLWVASNNLNLWQATNSRAIDFVVFDEAQFGLYKSHSQLSFLYPALKPGASIFIFGA